MKLIMLACIRVGNQFLPSIKLIKNHHLPSLRRQINSQLLSTLSVKALNQLLALNERANTCCVMFSGITDFDGSAAGSDNEKIWEEKAKLRSEMKRRLATITVEEKERQSEIVRNKLFNHDVYKKSQRISVFLSMDDEIRTLDILKKMFEDGKLVFIPRYSNKLGRMDMVLLNDWDDYEKLPTTRWNIKQPPVDDNRLEALSKDSGGLDLVIMPGLAFTIKGQRLGRGKGYYDNFLHRATQSLPEKPFAMAVAFKQQILPFIPTTESDFTVDEVIFENY
ncbi:hypothetical protein CHUAL_001152 [Chamberlinius hualienensis]